MSFRIDFTPAFWDDYESALRYIAEDLGNPQAAVSVEGALKAAIPMIADYPFSMHPYPTAVDRPHIYRSVKVKNYLAFYVVLENVIEFRRFLYAASDIPPNLK